MGKLVGVGEVVDMIYHITNIKYGVFMDMARFRKKTKKDLDATLFVATWLYST